MTNSSFRDRSGVATPVAFWYAQDSTISDAGIPAASQFGGTASDHYAINSTDGFVTLSTTKVSSGPGSGTHLTLASNTALLTTASLDIDSVQFVSPNIDIQSSAITTTGGAGQTYDGPVALLVNTTLSAGTDPITFVDTVSGTFGLAVDTTGATAFGGAVGGGSPLASLTTDAGGTTAINGGSVVTTGAQTFNDSVTLGMASTTLTGSSVSFTDDLTLGATTGAATGTLAVNGPLSLASGTTLASTFTGTGASQFGHVTTTSGTTYGSATVAVNYAGGFSPSAGDAFTVVRNGAAGSGQFTNAPAPGPVSLGGVPYAVTYAGGTGNDFVLTTQGPGVTSISPTTGPTAGGTIVTINGNNFTGVTAVDFGTTAATSFTVISDTQITATSPAGSGSVDVTVAGPRGTSTTSTADQFTYGDPDTKITSGPAAFTTSRTATFRFTGSTTPAGGSVTFLGSLDGAAFTAVSSPKTYSTLVDGPHTFVVEAVDSKGDADPTPATYTWKEVVSTSYQPTTPATSTHAHARGMAFRGLIIGARQRSEFARLREALDALLANRLPDVEILTAGGPEFLRATLPRERVP